MLTRPESVTEAQRGLSAGGLASSDLVVGFPGRTFKDWLHFLREIEFRRGVALLPPHADWRVLELGSGDGYLHRRLMEGFGFVVGSDSDLALYDNPRGPLAQSDAQCIPFRDSTFDLVFGSNVLEHVAKPELALREIRRVLKPWGFVLFSMPSPTWKILDLFLHYPGNLQLLLSWLEAPRDGKSVGPRRGWKAKVLERLSPRIHGVSRTHLQELLVFRKRAWIRVLGSAGFSVAQVSPSTLYSPFGFAKFHLLSLRDWISRRGLPSCWVYLLRRNT